MTSGAWTIKGVLNMTDDKQVKLKTEQTNKKQENPQPLLRSSRKALGRPDRKVEETAPKKQFWVQIRLLPIWLRIILVLLLLTGAAMFGAMIGYSSLGDGNPGDVFKKETWTHILDIIDGKQK
jgi:hypothetical protein